MTIAPPFLICETGLHGDGMPSYYHKLVHDICTWWTGWPRIVVKTQFWRDFDSSWYGRVVKQHDRDPLLCLKDTELRVLGRACADYGFGFAVTPHDATALAELCRIDLDYLKLGSLGAADEGLRRKAYDTGMPIIASNCLISSDAMFDNALTLTGVSAYPANQPWDGKGDGYTAHNVPTIATELAVQAAKQGAKVIEIHVSSRPFDWRPLPGDMCVSVRMAQFRDIAEEVGQLWNACQAS